MDLSLELLAACYLAGVAFTLGAPTPLAVVATVGWKLYRSIKL